MVTFTEIPDAPDASLFEVRILPGKDLGIVARVDIVKGTRIMTEEPFMTLPYFNVFRHQEEREAEVLASFQQLRSDQQLTFQSLHNSFPQDGHCGTFQTNCIQLLGKNAGVFANVCRINHSCIPNAHYTWRQDLNSETVHAIRDIPAGNYAFECDCLLCTLPPKDLQASDNRREEMDVLDKTIGAWLSETFTWVEKFEEAAQEMNLLRSDMSDWLKGAFDARDGTDKAPERILSDCKKFVELREKEHGDGDSSGRARACHDAFLIAVTHSDLARAAVFAKRLYDARLVMQGQDSPSVQRVKGLIESPSSDTRFGMSMKWESSVDMVPEGLDEDVFEGWLWKKGNWAGDSDGLGLRKQK